MERESNIIGIRVGVYAVVTSEDHILLVEKGRGPYTGQWGLPGGGMEPGETPIEALKHEMLEETGLKLLPDAELFTTMTAVVSMDDPTDSKIRLLGIAFLVALDQRGFGLRRKGTMSQPVNSTPLRIWTGWKFLHTPGRIATST